MKVWEYITAFLLLPFMAVFGVPIIILVLTQQVHIGWLSFYPWNFIPTISGCFLIMVGSYLLIITTYYFVVYGQGTVAHWSPPTKLVVHGIYRYTRNPMVLGVVLTVLGEMILFGSFSLFVLFLLLLIGNHILFIKYEEPDLIKRFGDDYIDYMNNVPRWLPRLRAWSK